MCRYGRVLLSNITRILHRNAKFAFETGESCSSFFSHSLDRVCKSLEVAYSCRVMLILLAALEYLEYVGVIF